MSNGSIGRLRLHSTYIRVFENDLDMYRTHEERWRLEGNRGAVSLNRFWEHKGDHSTHVEGERCGTYRSEIRVHRNKPWVDGQNTDPGSSMYSRGVSTTEGHLKQIGTDELPGAGKVKSLLVPKYREYLMRSSPPNSGDGTVSPMSHNVATTSGLLVMTWRTDYESTGDACSALMTWKQNLPEGALVLEYLLSVENGGGSYVMRLDGPSGSSAFIPIDSDAAEEINLASARDIRPFMLDSLHNYRSSLT